MKTNKNQKQVRVKIEDVWYLVEILDIDSDPAKVLVDGIPVDVKIKEKSKVEKLKNSTQKKEGENNPHHGKKQFKSPMPGTILSFSIKEGDTIITGDEVCILEAMKMQQSLKAELSGIVKKINFQPGSQVATDDILIELE